MSSINPTIVNLCRIRATLLDDDGTVLGTTDNVFVDDKPVSLQFTPEIETGDERTQKSGCGCIIATQKDPDTLKRFTFELVQGTFSPGLAAFLLGQDLVVDTEGNAIGVNFTVEQLTCGDTSSTPQVAFEAWAKAQVGSAAAALPWVHFVWPSTSWQLGQNSLSADFANPTYAGFSRGNTEWNSGPYGDVPADGTGFLDIDFFAFWMTDVDPPTASPDLQDSST